MTKDDLIKIFDECKKYNVPICVVFKLPNAVGNELIINPPENFENKLQYYTENYDDELNHKNGSGVKIVNALPIEFNLNNDDETETTE